MPKLPVTRCRQSGCALVVAADNSITLSMRDGVLALQGGRILSSLGSARLHRPEGTAADTTIDLVNCTSATLATQ
jgi:hypothetical protein